MDDLPVKPSTSTRMLSRRRIAFTGAAFVGALIVLAVCIAGFSVAEKDNLGSRHHIYPGREVGVWLNSGTYYFNQDPGMGSYPEDPSVFSVAGKQGAITVTGILSGFPVSVFGRLFLGTGAFAPAASFTVKTAGMYRIMLRPAEPDLSQVIVSDSYGTALDRTVPWAAGAMSAVIAMVICAFRFRVGRRRYVTSG